MTTGRPPIPIEQKKRVGTYRPSRSPIPLTDAQELPAATEPPKPLRPLGEAGQAFWNSIWATGLTWIAPQSDTHLVQLVAEQFDERESLRDQVLTLKAPRDRVALRELEKQLTSNMAALGLNPSERARLGFAFVKTENALERWFRESNERLSARQEQRESSTD